MVNIKISHEEIVEGYENLRKAHLFLGELEYSPALQSKQHIVEHNNCSN
jgi:hypothetical protein